MEPRLQLHVVEALFGTLGYPGEGPPSKKAKVIRNPRGFNLQHVAPLPTTPAAATGGAAANAAGGQASNSFNGGRPKFEFTEEWVKSKLAQHGDDGPQMIADRMNQLACERRRWQRRCLRDEHDHEAEASLKLPNSAPSMEPKAQQRRACKCAVLMASVLFGRPKVDQAKAINDLIETCTDRETRLLLRGESFVQRERFVAVRWAFDEMRASWWTAQNWLELRLKKFLTMRVFRYGSKLFSKTLNADGEWVRAVLLPVPSPQWRARQDGIYSPLFVPDPFRGDKQIKKAQDHVLRNFHFSTSADGKGVTLDPLERGMACMKHAKDKDNLRKPTERRPLRLQILLDAVGYFRMGRMVTRFGVRCLDLVSWHNATYFFKNVSIYLGADHTEELQTYLSEPMAKINAGSRSVPTVPTGLDEKGNEEVTTTIIHTIGEFGEVEFFDGGDAAAANAMAALEPPPSKQGCCHYCELRRIEWFNAEKCPGAKRRNFQRAQLQAHLYPVGAARGLTFICPCCDFEITEESEELANTEYKALSDNQQNEKDKIHRNLHAGTRYLLRKVLHTDHINRSPSLLHLVLNSVSSTMSICLAAGASKRERAAMNLVLSGATCYYRFRDKPGGREKKPAGNECRKLLWTPGIMLDLLQARYGKLETVAQKRAAADIAAAQREGEHMAQSDIYENAAAPPAAAPPPPKPPPPPPQERTEEDDEFASMAAEMGIDLPPPPPAMPPEQVLVESAPDDETELGMDTAADDECDEWSPDSVKGSYAQVLEALHNLLKMHLELHEAWDDDDAGLERERRSIAAQKKGAGWALSLRVVAGGATGHYYMHLAFAHLKELIQLHGQLQHGNDEVLERGNLTIKNLRDMTFKGGDSADDAAPMTQTRYRIVCGAKDGQPAVWESYTVVKPRQDSSQVAAFRMHIAQEELLAAKPYDGDTRGPAARARAATLAGRRLQRDEVKTETEAGLAKRLAIARAVV